MGLQVLLFPCNQFAFMESGNNDQIKKFVEGYSKDFMVFQKIDVNGFMTDPIYTYLRSMPENLQFGDNKEYSGGITWNFAKYLVD